MMGLLGLVVATAVAAPRPVGVVSESLRFKAVVPAGWTAGRDGRELSGPSRNAAVPQGIEVSFEAGLTVGADALVKARSQAQVKGPARAVVSPRSSRGRWRLVSARLERDGGVLIVWAAREAPGGAYLATMYAPSSEEGKAVQDFHSFLDSFQPSSVELAFRARPCGDGCAVDLPTDWESSPDGGLTVYGPAGPGGRAILTVGRVGKSEKGQDAAGFLADLAARPGVSAGPVQGQGSRGGKALVMEQRRVSAPELVEARSSSVALLKAWSVFDTGRDFWVVSCEAPEPLYADCVAAQRRATKSLSWGR